MPNPEKFDSSNPADYKNQKTRMQAKLRVTFSDASEEAKLDYIQSRSDGLAFDIISNFQGAEANKDSMFISEDDLQTKFDSNFLNVNERQTYVTKYNNLKQETNKPFKLFIIKYNKLSTKLKKKEQDKRDDFPLKLNRYFRNFISYRSYYGKSFAEIVTIY